MEVLTALGVICGLPLLIFWAGWVSCYLLVIKYRFHVERRWEVQEPAARRSQQAAEWQP
jgi:hypothetical protein